MSMKRTDLEEALAALKERDTLVGAITALKSGRANRVRMLVDGPAPMLAVQLDFATKDVLLSVQTLLSAEQEVIDAKLKRLGVVP